MIELNLIAQRFSVLKHVLCLPTPPSKELELLSHGGMGENMGIFESMASGTCFVSEYVST